MLALLPHITFTCTSPLDAAHVQAALNAWNGAAYIFQSNEGIVFWWPAERTPTSAIRERVGDELMQEVSKIQYKNIPRREQYDLPHLKFTCPSLLAAAEVIIFLRGWCGQSYLDSSNKTVITWWPERNVCTEEIHRRLGEKNLGQKVTWFNYFNLPDRDDRKRKAGNQTNGGGGGAPYAKQARTGNGSGSYYNTQGHVAGTSSQKTINPVQASPSVTRTAQGVSSQNSNRVVTRSNQNQRQQTAVQAKGPILKPLSDVTTQTCKKQEGPPVDYYLELKSQLAILFERLKRNHQLLEEIKGKEGVFSKDGKNFLTLECWWVTNVKYVDINSVTDQTANNTNAITEFFNTSNDIDERALDLSQNLSTPGEEISNV